MAFVVRDNYPVQGCIAWENVHIAYKGQVYAIQDGYTSYKYVWWDHRYPNQFVVGDTFPTLTDDDCLVFLNKNGIHVTVPTATIIDGSLIVPESILANALSANCVTSEKIAAGAVTADKIAANAVGAEAIAAGSILGDHIVAGAITGDKIAARTITANHLVTNTITAASGVIADAAITTAKIADGAVTNAKIANATITGAKIANATIDTANIKDGAITTAKIGNLQVTNAKIANGAVDNAKIANLDASKITSGYISAARIATGSITGDKIAAKTITADKLNVTSLSAISANLGTVTAGGNNNINGRIALLDSSGNEQAVMDVNGFVAKRGSTFRIDELGDGSEVTIVAKANMINDHSFEMLRTTGNADFTHLDFAFGGAYENNLFEWRNSGSPRVISRLDTGEFDTSLTPFGFQAAVVTNANYFYQYVSVWPGKTYTFSGYAYPHPTRNSSGTTVRSQVVIDFYDAELTYISFTTHNKTLTTNHSAGSARNNMKRHTLTFTVPAGASFVRVSVKSASSTEWVVWDGIQLVEGDRPTVYNPEDQLWMLCRGVSPGARLIRPIIYDGAIIRGNTILDGNVGIGTYAPAYKLDVRSFIRTTADLYLLGTSGNGFIFHSRYNASNAYDFLQITSVTNGTPEWSKGITFVRSSGNVGIGTTNPTSKLHVVGNFTATGTKSATVETEHYGLRKLYAIEAPDVRFIDMIKVDNLEGEQWVEINPMFAETISDYEVFYNGTVEILEKQPERFKVRGSGRAAFLIYGKRKGYEGIYMEQVGGEEVEH